MKARPPRRRQPSGGHGSKVATKTTIPGHRKDSSTDVLSRDRQTDAILLESLGRTLIESASNLRGPRCSEAEATQLGMLAHRVRALVHGESLPRTVDELNARRRELLLGLSEAAGKGMRRGEGLGARAAALVVQE